MIKHLITGGCSFSHYANSNENWVGFLEDKLKFENKNLTIEHTGFFSQGQELIQKKIMLAIVEALESGLQPNEIMVVVMWSGTFRKAWYIDNPIIIKQMTKLWHKFKGGMCNQFLDLKNKGSEKPSYFNTGCEDSIFEYNPKGGWYFTVNGSDSQMEFVQQHYLLDGHMTDGIGKVHNSIENIIMLQNFCKLNGVKLINQHELITLVNTTFNLNKESKNLLHREQKIIGDVFFYIHQQSPKRIESELLKLTQFERFMNAVDPQQVLKRGYSITLVNGKILSPQNLPDLNIEIETISEEYSIKSTINAIKKRTHE